MGEVSQFLYVYSNAPAHSIWRKDEISNGETGHYISSLNRTWSVKTYNVKTKKNNWAISTSISA